MFYQMTRLLLSCPMITGYPDSIALDVFSEGYGFGETVLALLIHLVPTYLVVIALGSCQKITTPGQP